MGLVIVGAGGHGSDTLELARRCGVEVVGVVDDGPDHHRLEDRAVFLGRLDDLPDAADWTLGVGYPQTRAALAAKLPDRPAAALVDPSAVVPSSVTLGVGVAIFWLVGLSPLVTVGDHAFVSYGATVGHDTTIGAFSTVMPGARLSGDLTVGTGVMIGTGAVVLQGVTIGDGAWVGAGAVVVADVPAGVTVRGVPARQ